MRGGGKSNALGRCVRRERGRRKKGEKFGKGVQLVPEVLKEGGKVKPEKD